MFKYLNAQIVYVRYSSSHNHKDREEHTEGRFANIIIILLYYYYYCCCIMYLLPCRG